MKRPTDGAPHKGRVGFADRIIGLERVPAEKLVIRKDNWRVHAPRQKRFLTGLLREVGWVGAVVARPLKDGRYEVLDGAARTDLAAGQTVPVLVVDVNAKEADKVLATFDTVGGMAGKDAEKLRTILRGLTVEDEQLAEAIAEIARSASTEKKPDIVFSETLDEANNYVVLFFRTNIDWLQAMTHFDLKPAYAKRPNGKPWSCGIGRVVDGSKYLSKVAGAESR